VPGRSCAVCGGGLPKGAAFCPHCGSRVTDELRAASAPAVAEPRLYGVTPPMTLLALAVAVLAVGVLLLVLDRPALGVVLIGLALLLGAGFVGGARRKPEPARAARAAPGAGAADRLRGRARLTRTSLSVRASARREVGRLARERDQLLAARGRLVQRLGTAVYTGDDAVAASLRSKLEELDRTAAAKEAEMQAVIERAHDEIGQARLVAEPTEIVESQGEPGTQPPSIPEPVPEPSPAPGPVTVPEPTPTPVPEPTPVPHEPPTPPAVPEPGPEAAPEQSPPASPPRPPASPPRPPA
jgi:hypothetical protein